MKFENPIMTISMFEVENVVTSGPAPGPGGDPSQKQDAQVAAQMYLNSIAPQDAINIVF